MLTFAILTVLFVAPFVNAQLDPYDICVGQEDGVMIGVGQEISCSRYFYCENEFGFEEDCVDQDSEYDFNYETGQCDYYDVVNCPAPAEPTVDPGTTIAPTVTQGPPTVPDGSVPECPMNRPGEIIFFESSNCTEYFICANGVRLRMTCMEGFTWNQDEQMCDYPIYSRCSVSY